MGEKTVWFPGDTKPVRVGVYERDIPGIGVKYSRFDGRWFGYCENPERAHVSPILSAYQGSQWRGLTYHAAKRAGTA